ncbi:MAG: helix-turn-helix domain-containing protein [Pyrinomonadaceae bacterium]
MDYRVLQVIDLMTGELQREVSLDELARGVGLSLSRLHCLFRNETGMSPARYRRLLRIEKAKELLETTHLNIKQIRIIVGIDDRSHFEREFKKLYGLTPVRHRFNSLAVTPPRPRGARPAGEMATK